MSIPGFPEISTPRPLPAFASGRWGVLLHLCEALYADPSDPRGVADWGKILVMSGRTLARRFDDEVGMSMQAWRRRLRLFKAIELVGGDLSVTQIALKLGYGSTSAFTYAFRTEMVAAHGRTGLVRDRPRTIPAGASHKRQLRSKANGWCVFQEILTSSRLSDKDLLRYGAIESDEQTMKPSEALAAHRAELRELVSRHGLLHPRVFGSALSGTDDEESDLDLLVDPAPKTSLLTLAGFQIEAEKLLGVRVSVLTPNALPRKFRNEVLQQARPL